MTVAINHVEHSQSSVAVVFDGFSEAWHVRSVKIKAGGVNKCKLFLGKKKIWRGSVRNRNEDI